MPHLMTEEDGEERERERKPARPATQEREVPGGRIEEHSEVGGKAPTDQGAGHRRQEQCGREQQRVHRPRFPRLEGGAREHEMAPIPLAGPVVTPWPLAEGGSQLWGGSGVGRIYKRVNNFPGVEGRGPPRRQI